MYRFLAVVISLPLICAADLPELQLGAPVPAEATRVENQLIMVSPAQMQPKWTWMFDGVEYTLGVDPPGFVQFISTSSTKVETLEGVRPGQTFATLETIEGVDFRAWPGWGYVAELPSGWNAAFFLGESMTDAPQPYDPIQLLFRGTMAGYGVRPQAAKEHPRETAEQ
jgi:hypothetical protein